jgi:hypothetical protein
MYKLVFIGFDKKREQDAGSIDYAGAVATISGKEIQIFLRY